MNISPSITTTKKHDWRTRIQEAQELHLTEIAFFPTCLNTTERYEAYDLLIKAGITSIPFIHLRSDMTVEEITLCQKTFGTKKFNVHAAPPYKAPDHFETFSNAIYVENSTARNPKIDYFVGEAEEIERFAGICLDTAHLENDRRLYPDHYKFWIQLLNSYECGAWHVSAIKPDPVQFSKEIGSGYDVHAFENVSEFDYLSQYKAFIPDTIALELENTLQEQLKAKEYIEKILKNE